MAGLDFDTRATWTNHTGNQSVDPLAIATPTTLAELCEAVHRAEKAGCTVRAAGSGHSWSDVALTDGFLLRPTGLNRPLGLEPELLRPTAAADAGRLVRVESGMTIRELNDHLDGRDLAMPNLGGFDGQTVAGVISTSTHGSGLGFGPLSTFVRSLDIVAAGGVVYRIEPQDGPTDRAAYQARHPERRLEQSDHYFNAAVVGMGCMGLIHSLILEVAPKFYLREVRSPSTWTEVRKTLADHDLLSADVHYEVLVNPYPGDGGEIECLVTTRNPVTPQEFRRDRRRARNWIIELAARLPITPWLINLAVGLRPSITPFLVHQALAAIVNPDYVNRSYKVLNIGAANFVPAYSAEIAVPVDARGNHIAAVERIVEIAARHQEVGQVYHSSPVALRFVKGTDAYLSMMQGSDTMMIELIMLTHSAGGMELLAVYEDALYDLGGRPHWGQINSLTGSHGLVESMYPHLPDWLAVHRELNSTGVFDSPFGKRVGISEHRFEG